MASLPQRQSSQRRASPEQTSHGQPTAQNGETTPHTPVRSRSATSEDSQTLFLNSPPAANNTTQTQTLPIHPTPTQVSDDQVKKCWICFADSTEDPTDSPPPWRSPCPCALEAHESCLLDWIADLEAPTSSPRNGRRNTNLLSRDPILCPQCKSEIKLERPRDVVVEAVSVVKRAMDRAVVPASLAVLATSLHQVSLVHGVWSVYTVFGARDGGRILQPLLFRSVAAPLELDARRLGVEGVLKAVGRYYLQKFRHWRLYVGLPLIGPVLMVSRTSAADYILPVLPVMFLASMGGEGGWAATGGAGMEDLVSWPPSAGVCFSLLPYVRAGYNEMYQRVFGEAEKRWMRAIMPRQGRGGEEGGQGLGEAGAQGEQPAEDENVFEIRVDGGIWDDWGREDDAPVQEVREAVPQQAPPLEQPPRNDNDAVPPPIQDNRPPLAELPVPGANNENAPPNQQPATAAAANNDPQANNNNAGERRLSFSPTAIAESILGALLFPALASASGEMLKLLLPSTWTVPPPITLPSSRLWSTRPKATEKWSTGILQHKWGRSLVGGCLLVMVKDAVGLYVKWRLAEMQRGRRVLDYRGRRPGVRAS